MLSPWLMSDRVQYKEHKLDRERNITFICAANAIAEQMKKKAELSLIVKQQEEQAQLKAQHRQERLQERELIEYQQRNAHLERKKAAEEQKYTGLANIKQEEMKRKNEIDLVRSRRKQQLLDRQRKEQLKSADSANTMLSQIVLPRRIPKKLIRNTDAVRLSRRLMEARPPTYNYINPEPEVSFVNHQALQTQLHPNIHQSWRASTRANDSTRESIRSNAVKHAGDDESNNESSDYGSDADDGDTSNEEDEYYTTSDEEAAEDNEESDGKDLYSG